MSVHLPEIKTKRSKTKLPKIRFNLGGAQNLNETSVSSKSPPGMGAFVLDSTVQNNYSAYRLNNNLGYGGGMGPKKVRMGFHGEHIDMEEYNWNRNQQFQNQQMSPNYGGTGFQQQYNNYQRNVPRNPLINPTFGRSYFNTNPDGSLYDPQMMQAQRIRSFPTAGPQFNVDVNQANMNRNPLLGHSQSDRGFNLNLARVNLNQGPGPMNPNMSQMYDLSTDRTRGGMNDTLKISPRRNNFSMRNPSSYGTPYISQQPSLMNIGDDMNLLKSVLDGSILKERSPQRGEINQSMVYKPILDKSILNQTVLDKSIVADKTQAEVKKVEEQKSQLVEEQPKKLKKKNPKDTLKKSKSVKIIAPTKTVRRGGTGKLTLRNVLWAIVYPGLWMKEVFAKLEAVRGEMLSETTEFIPLLTQVIITQCGDAFNSVYQEKKSLVLVSGEEKSLLSGAKELSAKEVGKRAVLVMAKLGAIMDSLHKIASDQVLFSSLLKFLGMISENGGIPPQEFLSEFELARLKFSNIATLKNMDPQRSKCALGTFFLIRIVTYLLLIKPWENVKTVKKNPALIKNLKSVSSVFYHVVMDYFRLTVPPVQNNQAFLSSDIRIKPRKQGPFIAYEEELNKEQEKKVNVKEEIIIGLYSRKQLEDFFKTSKEEIEKLQDKIVAWLGAMYNVTTRVYEEERRKTGQVEKQNRKMTM